MAQQKRVFLYSTNNAVAYWPDPGDWNPSANTVECVGAGGNGAVFTATLSNAGTGGSYAVGHNLALTFPVPYSIASGGTDPGAAGNVPTFATNFNVASNAPQRSGANVVSASCGVNGANGTGTGSNGIVWPAGFAGGSGGNMPPNHGAYGGAGGGGAGGPEGVGITGGAGGGSGAGAGGAANDGASGSGAGGAAGGGNGGSGTDWDASHGLGGGGGGGSSSVVNGGHGGQYGGGGGGANLTPDGAGGVGGDGLIVITYTPLLKPVGATRIYLYPYYSVDNNPVTPRQFPNPGNWNPNSNMIECVGSGSWGVIGANGDIQSSSGSGGGGGAYAYSANLSPTFPVNFAAPTLGTAQGGPSDLQWATWWNASTSNPGNIVARNGFSGNSTGTGAPVGTTSAGPGGNLAYPNGFNGGGGGVGVQNAVGGAGGGGGAAGPHGAGVTAANASGANSSAGGAGDAGNTPGVAGGSTNGTQWDHLHGVGSGSGPPNTNTPTSTAGLFGGGGGGGYGVSLGTPGPSAGGLIVITYTPLAPPQGQVQIMA